MSTNIDTEVQRLVQAEIDREEAARVERIREEVIERQTADQRWQDLIKRIADERAQAAQMREQAAAIRAEAEPHLAALERIEGQRPEFGRSARSVQLEIAADRWERGAEYLQFRLENPQ